MGIIKVTVVGGCGNKAAKNNGTFTVELPQETADLKMLKTLCRKHFGKYPSHTQAAFTMGDTAADGKAVTSADIKDGIVIRW